MSTNQTQEDTQSVEGNVDRNPMEDMEGMEGTQMGQDPTEVFRTHLESWDLIQKSKEEQVQWFRETVIVELAQMFPLVLTERDEIEEVYIIDRLAEPLVEALNSAEIPDELIPDVSKQIPGGQEAVEQIKQAFRQFCSQISVFPTPLEQFVNSNVGLLPQERQFIHVTTREQKARAYVEAWDQKMQITTSLRQGGCPVTPTYQEKRMLFLFAHMLDRMSQMGPKIQKATGRDINMT